MTQSQNKQKDYKHQEKIYIYNLLYNVKHYISYRKKGPTGPKAVRYWNGGGGGLRGDMEFHLQVLYQCIKKYLP